jgi:hypothetical protein
MSALATQRTFRSQPNGCSNAHAHHTPRATAAAEPAMVMSAFKTDLRFQSYGWKPHVIEGAVFQAATGVLHRIMQAWLKHIVTKSRNGMVSTALRIGAIIRCRKAESTRLLRAAGRRSRALLLQ